MDSQRRRRWRLKCALRNHPTRNQWFGSSTLLARIAAASPSQRLASGLLSRLVSSAFCFRRQMPFGTRFIADFCAPSIKLMVEVDGGYRSGRNRRSVPSGLERAAAGCGVPKCLVASFRPALTMPPSAISSLERKAELYCAQAQALGANKSKAVLPVQSRNRGPRRRSLAAVARSRQTRTSPQVSAFDGPPGCSPARCGINRMQIQMKTIRTAEAVNLPNPNPP